MEVEKHIPCFLPKMPSVKNQGNWVTSVQKLVIKENTFHEHHRKKNVRIFEQNLQNF